MEVNVATFEPKSPRFGKRKSGGWLERLNSNMLQEYYRSAVLPNWNPKLKC